MKVKIYYTYKTTNIKTGEYYLGKHETYKLDDGYLGSGNRLRASIKKYGKDFFNKEILEFYGNREDLINGEVKLITNDILNDKLCLNLTFGGQGGKVYERSNDTNKKLSKSLKNRDNWWGNKVSKALKGKKQPKERIIMAANSRRGYKNGSWVNCDINLIYHLYVNKLLSIREISKKLNIGRKVITCRLISLGCEIRTSKTQKNIKNGI